MKYSTNLCNEKEKKILIALATYLRTYEHEHQVLCRLAYAYIRHLFVVTWWEEVAEKSGYLTTVNSRQSFHILVARDFEPGESLALHLPANSIIIHQSQSISQGCKQSAAHPSPKVLDSCKTPANSASSRLHNLFKEKKPPEKRIAFLTSAPMASSGSQCRTSSGLGE